jgi:hypothetical protein
MIRVHYGLVLASVFAVTVIQASQFADKVVDYTPGSLPPNLAGYTNASAALGSPSRQTIDPNPNWGGTFAVDPYNAPYLSSQVVSVGARGSLTVGFVYPIQNAPDHPYGIDFIIYGNASFVITNGDYSGGGITDGSLYGGNPGATTVSVSADGYNFYELHASLTPVVDGYFPTDGAGDFTQPVNPDLSEADFAGTTLDGIRHLYAGSAGGTGFDLSWAQTTDGQPANLTEVHYLRVMVQSGHSEIDGFSTVIQVPEPGTIALGCWSGVGILIWRQLRIRGRRADIR